MENSLSLIALAKSNLEKRLREERAQSSTFNNDLLWLKD